MSEEDFDLVALTDGAYGVAGVLVTITGYLRVTQYAKVCCCCFHTDASHARALASAKAAHTIRHGDVDGDGDAHGHRHRHRRE